MTDDGQITTDPGKRHRPTRAEVLAGVAAVLDAAGPAWAWQGEENAPDCWADATGPKDLDVWTAGSRLDAEEAVAALRKRFVAVPIAAAHDPRRLRHVSIAVLTTTGPAVVDLTYGHLAVGPVLLIRDTEITVDPATHRLTGVAATADLLVRPVLRGRIPAATRLTAARANWAVGEPGHREELARRLTTQLGARVAADLITVAEGGCADLRLPGRARVRLAAWSLRPAVASSTWAQRGSVVPAGPAAGPYGLRTRGVVVALVGTDGSGKSTVAAGLREALREFGFTTSTAYFGMARGNLPGIALARRLLGVGSTTPPAIEPGAASSPAVETSSVETGAGAAGPEPAGPVLTHAPLRKAAAWVYAAEYVWRYLSTVAPALARREVVIADRWVYDLRESPWPGSPAARVAELLIPAPDLLVLPDAPADVIHGRKPERSRAEQAAQQERFRALLAERPARLGELVVNTSGPEADTGDLVAAIVRAAHGGRRR